MNEEKTNGGKCPWNARLGAFHDDELSEHEVALMRSHLEVCPECRDELHALERVSGLLAGAHSPTLAARAARVMAARACRKPDALARTARVLTECAAAMLVVFSVFAVATPAEHLPVRDMAVEAAAVSPGEPDELAAEPDYELANWIVADLSSGGER